MASGDEFLWRRPVFCVSYFPCLTPLLCSVSAVDTRVIYVHDHGSHGYMTGNDSGRFLRERDSRIRDVTYS